MPDTTPHYRPAGEADVLAAAVAVATRKPTVHHSGLIACAIRRLLNGLSPPRRAWDDLTDIAWRRDCGDDPVDYHATWRAAQKDEYGAAVDDLAGDPQQNASYGVHQFAVRLPGDPNIYRVLIATADAPITIAGVPADRHFAEPLIAGVELLAREDR